MLIESVFFVMHVLVKGRDARMKPKINSTDFGSITIEGEKFEHDVVIRLDGSIKKRKKKLSKAIYGTSHVISLDEAMAIFEEKAERLIIGTGQNGLVRLSDEAADYFQKERCQVELLPTPEAIRTWNQAASKNQAEGAGRAKVIGLFHVTC
jgi:hypothetical protein